MHIQSLPAQNKRLAAILLTATALLSIPLIAMLSGADGVQWGLFDFIIAAILLFGTGLACELVLRKLKRTSYRAIVCAVVLLGLALIWAELAVGIFGSPLVGS
jgi:asparagine N-glycosylation enzyme membrane subunit Stt3